MSIRQYLNLNQSQKMGVEGVCWSQEEIIFYVAFLIRFTDIFPGTFDTIQIQGDLPYILVYPTASFHLI